MHYTVLNFVARWRRIFCEIEVKDSEKSKNRRKRLCAPFRIERFEDCSSLGPRM